MQNEKNPRFTIKQQTTPLGPKNQNPTNELRLASNEDDDLYDPYSDFHDGNLSAPHYEEDPWR